MADDLIEAIARRVVELLRDELQSRAVSARLMTAEQVADHLGVSRSWVYEHAQDLGAIKLGPGPKAPLRFDVFKATASFTVRNATSRDLRPTPRLPREAGGNLLPIRGRRDARRA